MAWFTWLICSNTATMVVVLLLDALVFNDQLDKVVPQFLLALWAIVTVSTTLFLVGYWIWRGINA